MSEIDCTVENRVLSDKTGANFQTWYEATNSELLVNKMTQRPPEEAAAATSLQLATITRMFHCFQKQKQAVPDVATEAEQLRQANELLAKELEEAAGDVEIARERAQNVAHPEAQTTYRQSWLPIDRPLRASTLPILLGVALFFLIMFFGFLLGAFGVRMSFEVQVARAFGLGQSPFFMRMLSQFTLAFWVVALLLVAAIAVAIAGWTR